MRLSHKDAARDKYAELTITSMVQVVDTVQPAKSHIDEWAQKLTPEKRGDSEVFLAKATLVLENGTIFMDALEGDLKSY